MSETKKRVLYIFFTADIRKVGGMQMYVLGLAELLEKKGAHIAVIHGGRNTGAYEIPLLSKYSAFGNELLNVEPTAFNNKEIDKIVQYTIQYLGVEIGDYDDIYIESHADILALWAELFAERLGGKHVMLTLNEVYSREKTRYYEYRDFFWHLYKQKRLIGTGVYKLFANTEYTPNCDYECWAVEKEPIDDIECQEVESIERSEWNIAYIGRGNKQYVPTILEEIRVYADKHKEVKITFTFVGDASGCSDLIEKHIQRSENIRGIYLGNQVPIPKSLFKKIDVVIANSQTAYFCALEGVPVILVETTDNLSHGVLGYNGKRSCDVNDPNPEKFKPEKLSDTLEDVFIKKEYKKNEFILDKRSPTEQYYANALKTFEHIQKNSYYDVRNHVFEVEPLASRNYIKELQAELSKFEKIPVGGESVRIAIFGAGEEGSACVEWAKNNDISIALLVDNNINKWDTYICGIKVENPDKLKQAYFGYVVICNIFHARDILEQIKKIGISEKICTTYRCIRLGWLREYEKK